MNGSLLGNSSGETTITARCPSPMKPGAGGPGVTILAMRRSAMVFLLLLYPAQFGRQFSVLQTGSAPAMLRSQQPLQVASPERGARSVAFGECRRGPASTRGWSRSNEQDHFGPGT